MVTTLEQIHQAFEERLLRFMDSKQWQWKAVALVAMLSIISILTNIVPLKHYLDYFDALKNHREYFAYQTVLDRANDFLGDHHYKAMTGLENRTFRWTQPIIATLIPLRPVSLVLYLLQIPLGLLFFKLIINFLYKLLHNKLTVLYLTAAIACIYPGMAFWIDFSGYGDFYSYFFLFIAIYFRSPWLIYLFASLAFWNDERAFVAGVFVGLWWFIGNRWATNQKVTLRVNPQLIALILAWLSYGVLRFYVLEHLFGLKATYNEGEFEATLPQNLAVWGFKIGWSLESLWLLPIITLVILIYNKLFFQVFVIYGGTFAVLLLSLVIYDTTRSTSFTYLMLFTTLAILSKTVSESALKKVSLLVSILCFLHPLATKTSAIGFFLM